jgi:hypothetical protein
MQPKSKVLVVTGMHRSGTSMIAGFFERAGLFIGSELLPAHVTNEKGFFEDVEFVKLHEAALTEAGQPKDGWTDHIFEKIPQQLEAQADKLIATNDSHDPWGWKDPRTCLFLNYWAKKLPAANFVFIFRPPWEVADSLYRRGDEAMMKDPKLAFAVWQAYNNAILSFCESYPQRTLLVSIDEVVASPSALIQEVNRKFGLTLKDVQPDYDQSLLNKRAKQYQRVVAEAVPDVYAVWQRLENTSWRGGTIDVSKALAPQPSNNESPFADWLASGKVYQRLNDARLAHQSAERECKRLYDENMELRRQLYAANEHAEHLQGKIDAISNSKVWRIRNAGAALLGKPPV